MLDLGERLDERLGGLGAVDDSGPAGAGCRDARQAGRELAGGREVGELFQVAQYILAGLEGRAPGEALRPDRAKIAEPAPTSDSTPVRSRPVPAASGLRRRHPHTARFAVDSSMPQIAAPHGDAPGRQGFVPAALFWARAWARCRPFGDVGSTE